MELIINLYNLFFTVCGTQTTFSRSIALATTFQWLETIFNLAFKVFISNSSFASLTCFERNSPFGEYWRRTLPTCNCTNMFSTISGKKGQITYPQGVCWPHNVTWPLLPCLCCMQKWIKNENVWTFWILKELRSVQTLATLIGRAEWMTSSKLNRANRKAALMMLMKVVKQSFFLQQQLFLL